YTIANEGRRLIECDRVSVAVLKGGKAKVVAISGQDSIESRSNIVQSLNNLATRVVKSGEPLWYDGATEDLPPQLEEAIEDYVDLSHGRTVTVLPIRQPERKTEGDVLASRNESSETRQRREIIGALIVEQIETQLSKPVLEGRVDLVYEHACRAMSNSLAHSNILFMPVWRFLDRALWMFRGSTLPKTLAILGVITMALAAMFIVPMDFKLKGNGELKPTEEKHVFAHANGNVEEVYVRHGDFVKAGQPLVRMRDDDLSKEIVNLEDQIMQAAQRVENRTRTLTLDSAILTPSERERLTQEKIESETTLKGLETQLQLARQMEAKMVRTSPIDGVVMTWDVERMLNRRPVVMGQVLMTIADKEKDWEVEVLLPEKRMSYLLQAFEDEKAKNPGLTNSQQLMLPVDFIMMTDPSKSYSGKLSYSGVSGRAELNAEDGPVVKLRCNPDPESLKALSRNPGARVIAKVKAGRRSAAFVWFHEVVEWVRAYLLF
nr:efflux RND transporter periplasmic adaptor subunit [Pirellula sp.]